MTRIQSAASSISDNKVSATFGHRLPNHHRPRPAIVLIIARLSSINVVVIKIFHFREILEQ